MQDCPLVPCAWADGSNMTNYIWCHNHGIMAKLNVHELFTVFKAHRKSHLPSCTVHKSIVIAAAVRTLNLLVLLRRPHPSMQVTSTARTRHCNSDVLALSNLPPGYDEEQTSSLALLEARWPWPAEQASRNTRCFALFVPARMHLYGHPCLCTRHCNSD